MADESSGEANVELADHSIPATTKKEKLIANLMDKIERER
jgi:hypothetical protein